MFSTKPFKSLFDLMQAFPDEESCIKHLETLRWAGNVVSPFDATSTVYKLKGNKYKCRNTNKYFNVRTETIFEGTKISLQKWFMAIYIFTSHKKGISSHQLAKDLDITQKTSWFMLQRIRYAMEHPSFLSEMEGTVQVDEAFVGGKNKNRHHDKKVEKSQGRSHKDKTPVFGMLETEESYTVERPHKLQPEKTVAEKVVTKEGRVQCMVIPDTSREIIQPLLIEKLKVGSTLYSDEWSAYSGLGGLFYNHQIVDHSRGQYVNEAGATTNGMENFWTHFKRGWGSTYSGRVTRKHLQHYTNEFTFRYNTKGSTTSDRFNILLQGTPGKRITYHLLTKAE